MTMRGLPAVLTSILMVGCGTLEPMPSHAPEAVAKQREFTVIAHRGASAYLPEHTLEGAAMAHGMGVDYIEQDVVLTRDGVLIVQHDLYLDAVTDVAERFPGRRRADGLHYAIDFSLEEIRSLRVHERVTNSGRPVYPRRFPPQSGNFRVATLQEHIELISGLNRSTGREIGLYIEPKSPAWHAAEGKDLMSAVLERLAAHDLTGADDPVLLQSFDSEALRRVREELRSGLRLVQLIGENSWNEGPTDFDSLRSAEGVARIAEYAQGVGIWIPQVVDFNSDGTSDISDFTALAQRVGLFVHAYTLRADRLPSNAGSLANAVRILVDEAGLDGVFTDHPDQVLHQLHRK